MRSDGVGAGVVVLDMPKYSNIYEHFGLRKYERNRARFGKKGRRFEVGGRESEASTALVFVHFACSQLVAPCGLRKTTPPSGQPPAPFELRELRRRCSTGPQNVQAPRLQGEFLGVG